ncbi:MAG: electron transport complex subunit RsxC [bacterium]|nr:electron transport complex subunit RsxC [bacterium]
MRRATFKGGVRPYNGKDITKDQAIQVIMPTGDLVYPLSQHIGAPSTPVVAVGDQVLVGQVIAEASSAVSANICCSVSGKVKAIEKRLTNNGNMIESIVVENDGEYKTIDGLGEKRDYTKLSKEEIRTIVKEAGIVGLGGAGFPTSLKITPADDNSIEYVIVNGAECEPYLTTDYRLMLEETEKLIGGLKIVLSLFPNAKGIIAIEDNKAEAIEVLKKATESEANIEVKVLKSKYPQGGERTLIYATTGRKINSTMLPADVGCIVNNVFTLVSIYDAVCESTPLIRRVITVTGDCVANPGNFSVRTGMNCDEIIEAAGGFTEQPEKIISGGPMMGVSLVSTNVPVTKISSALVAFKKDIVAEVETSNCIHCAKCVSACPSGLVPAMLNQAVKRNDMERFEALNGLECTECGSCSYVCPAKIQLTQAFKGAKKRVMDAKKKEK